MFSAPSSSFRDVQLQHGLSRSTPSKPLRRGVPTWYKGKMISPAFVKHIFWPSPLKKQKNVKRELLPACASSLEWRDAFRRKSVKPVAKSKKSQLNESNNDKTDSLDNISSELPKSRTEEPQSRKRVYKKNRSQQDPTNLVN